MEALVIALSIDYACFILGRFIEECVIAENDVVTSVENTLATAGGGNKCLLQSVVLVMFSQLLSTSKIFS